MITIKKGLDLPISGAPRQEITDSHAVNSVALIGYDYHGMKPTMLVREGDAVKKGQPVFSDKKNEGVVYTAPASGVVSKINRGKRRVFQSLVIEVKGDEKVEFKKYTQQELVALSGDEVASHLVETGMWTSLRTRPYSKAPKVGSKPAAIFVQAMDTNPLAASTALIIEEQKEAFQLGLTLLTKLTDGKVWVCKAPGTNVPTAEGVSVEEFAGVHPAGNPGTHIHYLDPVSASKVAWTIGAQDVIAMANLFTQGELDNTRVVALGGPQVKEPRLVRTVLGASLAELTQDELESGDSRLISGSVFGGRGVSSVTSYLGRFHTQISVLENDHSRPMVHWLRPGLESFSVLNIYFGKMFKGKKFNFSTSQNGSERAMMPVGQFERVMPLDILPTQLLRAIAVGDLDSAEQLGALELDEEDLALCTYVCAGKYEYGPILRDNLTRIEAEG
jgi:Na+-transporting NADH:ubiquinone oxidoreductase subunit A